MTPSIRAVVFDFGGVLTLAPGARFWGDLMASISGRDGTLRLESLQAEYRVHRDGFDRGELSARAYWAAILRGLGAVPDEGVLRRLFELDTAAWTRGREPVLQWAARLRAAGLRTGILSNMPSEVLIAIEAEMHWVGEFSPRVYSCRLGLIKPEAAIYRALLHELDLPAQAVLFLDDREENVQAARELGIRAERFESLEQILRIAQERYALPGMGESFAVQRGSRL